MAPLSGFPALRTGDPDRLRQWLSPLFAVQSVEIRGERRDFFAEINHREMKLISLTSGRYGTAVGAKIFQADFFFQGFPLTGKGSVMVNKAQGSVHKGGGAVGGPGSEFRADYDREFAHVMLRLKPEGIVRKLSAMLGRPIDPPLRMADGLSDPGRITGQRRLLDFILREIDSEDGPPSPLVLAELEQALIVSYLTSHAHNYSALLAGMEHYAAPAQVRRVEEFIEQNWDSPIEIEMLASVGGVSVRSLFYSFRKSRGMTPMAFARQVRIRHARAMLANPVPGTTVTSVALACGFGNAGHFARYYAECYGEKPSETLGSRLHR